MQKPHNPTSQIMRYATRFAYGATSGSVRVIPPTDETYQTIRRGDKIFAGNYSDLQNQKGVVG